MTWQVYGLIDPRTADVFYIGISCDVARRLREHSSNQNSAAYEMCRDILKAGLKLSHCFFGEFALEEAARFLERQLIVAIPRTYNQTYFEEGCQLWAPFREKMVQVCNEAPMCLFSQRMASVM